MSIAVLSDIHGNRWALAAVLEDVRRRGISRLLNLGDSLYGPLDPAGTADVLMTLDCLSVSGNEDRLLLEPAVDRSASPSLASTLQRLRPAHLDWLKGHEPVVVVGRCLLCHGTPRRDDEYLLHHVAEDGVRERTVGELAECLGAAGPRVVLCGHDHLPGCRPLPDGRLVVNPGSVGLPAFRDAHPFPHAMAAGSPHARYGILDLEGKEPVFTRVTVSYDWERAALCAAENDRPDWARWLRTGMA